MKKKLFSAVMLTASAVMVFFSCKQENPLPPPPTIENEYPLANAGADRSMILPVDSVFLDGTESVDPDGSIIRYQWTQATGPRTCIIVNPDDTNPLVTNLTEGYYSFRLTVTDDRNMKGSDEVNVLVYPVHCDVSNRGETRAVPTEIGTLSVTRQPSVASAGNKLIFAGGYTTTGTESNAVDIFDITTNNRTTAQLSVARYGIAAAGAANKVLFAGGTNGQLVFDDVDIYDVGSNTWTTAHLSEPKSDVATIAAGNKIFFAGGFTEGENWFGPAHRSNKVEIYDLTTGTWSVASLSEAKVGLAVATVGSKVYFAGGFNASDEASNTVDVYDCISKTWSTTTLRQISGYTAAAVYGDNIYWVGNSVSGLGVTKLEIWNTANNSFGADCLSFAINTPLAVAKNKQLAFFGRNSSGRFEVLDAQTGVWNKVYNPVVEGSAIISAGNSIYMAGYPAAIYATNKVYALSW